MSAEKILSAWKKKEFLPVYWLEGEEDYYIDELMNYAEHNILPESETSFNLTIFYGKDADWAAVINACKRYPMFAEKQVVLLKEAQHMLTLDKLEPYIAAPLQSTIFVIGYKEKGYDKRSKFYKLLQKHTELFNSTKIWEGKINDWIIEMVKSKGYTISPKAASLLEEHVGNDLSRLANEIDKLAVNLQKKQQIDETAIEKYIGISKEYNVFELQAAIARKDLPKAVSIIGYFELNPKAGTIHMAVPAFYAHFSKVYAVYGMNDKSDAALRPFFYNNPNSLKQAQLMMKNYGYAGMEKIILLLHQYNLKSIGIGDTGTNSASLMKELVVKMILC